MKNLPVIHPLYFLSLLILFSLTTHMAHAASLKNLLFSPGDLISAHQKFDDDCTSCHSEFSKDKQTPLCLDCHEDIEKDLQSASSFHGLDPEIKNKECKTCHSDHKGRDFEAIIFDIDSFNHQLTNFPLKHQHKTLNCAQCHTEKDTFRIEKRECNDCHQKQDIHKGHMGKQCTNCHNSKSWTDSKFNHNKTDFPLLHKHQDVACSRCHLTPDYKEAPKKCVSCHAVQDVHSGKLSNDCGQCHSEKSWSNSKFDHAKKTDFPLKGKHQNLRCASCHTSENKKDELPTQCAGCHTNTDIHQGEFGTKCQACHQENNWQDVNFDHAKKTDFPLSGKHKSLSCKQCHGKAAANLSMFAGLHKQTAVCSDCHRQDDPHENSLGSACESCHEESSWKKTTFNHDLTKFPLIGMHKSADCQACHISENFKEATSECKACHAQQDPHKPSFGNNCQQCHNPNDWGMWLFDHDLSTNYALKGAHKNLQCELCHSETMSPSTRCYSCHRQNDVHRGAFGQQCQQCHTVDSFHQKLKRY